MPLEEKTPRDPILYQALAVTALNTMNLMNGVASGFNTNFVAQIERDGLGDNKEVTVANIAFIGSALSLGQIVGAVCGGVLTTRFGRKRIELLLCVPVLVAWTALYFWPSVGVAVASRVLLGMAIGMSSAVFTPHVCELASPVWRGLLVTSGGIVFTIGVLGAFALGGAFHWQWLCLSYMSLPLLCAVGITFTPESPIWLVRNEHFEQAREVMLGLRNSDTAWVAEMNAMRKHGTFETLPSFRRVGLFEGLKQRRVLLPMSIVAVLFLASAFSGINAIMSYGVSIFQESGSSMSSQASVVVLGAIQVVGSSVGALLSPRVRRRTQLMVSLTTCSATTLAMAVSTHVAVDAVKWLPLVCLVIFTLAFACGLGPLPWIITGELMPNGVRSAAMGALAALFYVFAFLSSLSFPYMLASEAVGLAGAFGLYAAVNLAAAVFVYAVLPETAGKSFAHLQDLFQKKKSNTCNSSS